MPDDGFELAEVDLEIRGEGTIFSERQKGRSDLKLASLRRDKKVVKQARDAAVRIVDADPTLVETCPELADELRLFLDPDDEAFLRSEKSRGGKEGVSTCRSRGWP